MNSYSSTLTFFHFPFHFLSEGSFGCHQILYPSAKLLNANGVVPFYRKMSSLEPVHLSVGTYLLVGQL